MHRTFALLLLVCGGFNPLIAQDRLTEHTLALAEDAEAGRAKIEVMSFLVGVWQGEALGGVVEESWLTPVDGAMLGMFRLSREGKPAFYELQTLTQVGETLELNVKHFSPALEGWEAKDEKVTFRLVKAEQGRVYFHGLTFEATETNVTLYLAVRTREGDYREEVFRLKRVK